MRQGAGPRGGGAHVAAVAARGRYSQSGRKNQQDLQMDLIWNVVGREAEN